MNAPNHPGSTVLLQPPEGTIAGPLQPGVAAFLAGGAKKLLIGGRWVPAKSGQTFESVNPANERVLARVARGDREDVDAAVKAARKAFETGPWPAMSPHERSRCLRQLAEVIEAHAEELAELECLDNGSILTHVKGMISYVSQLYHYYSGWPTKIFGETNPSIPDILNYTLREPLGVCGLIVPWNGPLSAATLKVAPALACGNTVVVKPAEQTPLSALRFGELVAEAGIPDGVVNIVTGFGPEAGSALVEHTDVDKIGFTGSGETAKLILAAAASTFKRVSLELGGKSPNIIFPDGNLDEAIPNSLMAFCFLAGQVCASGTRLFVHESMQDEVVDRLVDEARKIRIGDPFDPATTMGPLNSREQFDRVKEYLAAGSDEGAIARTGGSMVDGQGFFVEPTIFTGVDHSMRIAKEEIFGPVLSVLPFKDEDDAVFQANDTNYGLAAYVWTRDISRAHKVARALKAGSIRINTTTSTDPINPFGGYKHSGYGREGSNHSIELYTQIKSVWVKL